MLCHCSALGYTINGSARNKKKGIQVFNETGFKFKEQDDLKLSNRPTERSNRVIRFVEILRSLAIFWSFICPNFEPALVTFSAIVQFFIDVNGQIMQPSGHTVWDESVGAVVSRFVGSSFVLRFPFKLSFSLRRN